jgi:hypothetical protein
MASTYLAVNMSESAELSKSQRIERDLSVSSLEFDERKQNRKEVAIFVKALLDYLERANELELKQLTKAVSDGIVFLFHDIFLSNIFMTKTIKSLLHIRRLVSVFFNINSKEARNVGI